MKPIYYSLWDLQCNRRMYTGLNCTSKDDVKNQLWDYFMPEREEVFLTNDINNVSLDLLLEVGEFTLETSEEPFKDEYV
jgi:hypothetical protein